MVVLIPVRAGSKRIPHKWRRELGGKPLLQWTVDSCREWSMDVVVAADDKEILDAARALGAGTWRRPAYTASDDAPDLTWLTLALARWPQEELFCVRRITSPFLGGTTLRRAVIDLCDVPDATAMRAMRPVTETPYKMWRRVGSWMEGSGEKLAGVEACSVPTQLLPRVYVQTAGLEIIRRSTLESGSLTGDKLLPLFLDGPEALDINTPEDWAKAEEIAKTWTPS